MPKTHHLREMGIVLETTPSQFPIKNSNIAANICKDDFSGLSHEEAIVIYLDSDYKLKKKILINIGGSSETTIDKKRILRNALLLGCNHFILFHNHPSGSTIPSKADIEETVDLAEACDALGLNIVDHIIITKTKYYSFSDEKTHRYKSTK